MLIQIGDVLFDASPQTGDVVEGDLGFCLHGTSPLRVSLSDTDTAVSLRGDIWHTLRRRFGFHPVRVRVFVQVQRCRRRLHMLDQPDR